MITNDSMNNYNIDILSEVIVLPNPFDSSLSILGISEDNATIESTNEAAAQAYEIVQHNAITTSSGKQIPISAETLCVHGDGLVPFEIIQAIHSLFAREGIRITRPIHH